MFVVLLCTALSSNKNRRKTMKKEACFGDGSESSRIDCQSLHEGGYATSEL